MGVVANDCVSIKGLRIAHFRQLMAYIEERDVNEWYYGNKEHFEKRHRDLIEWVDKIIDELSANESVSNK